MTLARRSLVLGIACCAALPSLRAFGQQPRGGLPRVALVFNSGAAADMAGANPVNPYARTFVHTLRDLGLIEGRNILIERRSAEGRAEQLPKLMQELVMLNVDVIVAFGPGVPAAQRATDRIPIVGLVSGALDAGLIDSLARPGRNLTGFGDNFPGFAGKQLQLLKEAVPAISRVAVIASHPRPGPHPSWRGEVEDAGRSMQLDLRWYAVDAPDEFEQAFAAIVHDGVDAVYVASTDVNFTHLPRIANLSISQRLPSCGSAREFAEAGGLLSYGYGLADDMRHAAAYVKKILGGAKPSDLPFEQPTKIELVINVKTARTLGIALPQSLLLRADEVIR